MIKVLLPGENPDLVKEALQKCVNYFKSLTYEKVEKRPLVKTQISLHESLVNWTGELIYNVSKIRPIDDKPCLRFAVKIWDKTEFFQPWLSDSGNAWIEDLWEILTEDELYALGLDWVQKNLQWWNENLKDNTAKWTLKEDHNGAHTKESLAEMEICWAKEDLELLKSVTKDKIKSVLKIWN
jgi:hypothetical protein